MPALIVLAYGSLLIQSFLDNARGPFYPEILADLHLNGAAGSAFFAVVSLFAFFGSWRSHAFLQKHSSRFLLAMACVGLGLGYAGIALSPGYWPWLLACALFGWAFGALNVAQNVMILEASPARGRRRYFSGLHSMYAIASLFAPLMASGFRWAGLDWRGSFLCLALLPLAVAGFCQMTRSRSQGVRPPPALALNRTEWKAVLLFALLLAAYLWGEISLSSRVVLWLRHDLGLSPDAADLYLSGFFLTFFIGRALFGLLHFARITNWTILWVSAGLSAAAYALALTVSPLWILVTGLMLAPFYPVAMEQVSALFPAKSPQALSFVIGFGSLSVVVMHAAIGFGSDLYGIGRALLVGPICLFLVFVGLTGRKIMVWSRRAEPQPP